MKHPIVYFSTIPNCNSSSSHHLIMPTLQGESRWGDGYGWERFVLEDKQEKLDYLHAMAYHLEIEHEFCRRFGQTPGRNRLAEIDHQSIWHVPEDAVTGEPCMEYIWRLMQYIVDNDDIYIGGGNDNSDDDPEWYKIHPMDIACRSLYSKCFKHDKDHWILYSGYNKAIVNFAGDDTTYPYTVDCKITSYCERECDYCYQHSNKSGKHAPLARIKKFINKCADSGIIEIAFGGGEPTKHPKANEIFAYCRKKGISANVTTRCLDAVKENKDVSAFAISVDSMEEAEAVSNGLNTEKIYTGRNFHLIAWPKTLKNVLAFLVSKKDCKYKPLNGDVVLLAPKHTNIVSTERENRELAELGYKSYSDCVKSFCEKMFKLNYQKSTYGYNNTEFDFQVVGLAADIPMFSIMNDIFKNNELLPDPMYGYTEEGKFSFYYDAVENKTYTSSYDKQEITWSTGKPLQETKHGRTRNI